MMTSEMFRLNVSLRSLMFLGFVIFAAAAPGRAAAAEPLNVACAANFTDPLLALASRFEAKTGEKIRPVFGSTGQLYTQIAQGAPIDLFFAADEERPDRLHAEGLADAPVVYALGRVVLWSLLEDVADISPWTEVVLSAKVKLVAMANPQTAPYGAAALAALEKQGIAAKVAPRLVQAQNITQAFQFAATAAADVAFVALSATRSAEGVKGRTWPMPQADPIVQSACVLSGAARPDAAWAFLNFVLSPEGREIVAGFGYE